MDYYRIIAQNFQGTIETITLSVDKLAQSIEQASRLLVAALLEDRKIVACGSGTDAALAQLFTSYLLCQFEQERPVLPAITLGTDPTSSGAVLAASGSDDMHARQLRALGQAGDILLCINSGAGDNALARAIQTARERNMAVILLSNSGDSGLATLLGPEDVQLQVEALRRPRIVELHTMIINCLCQLVDMSLFGNFTEE